MKEVCENMKLNLEFTLLLNQKHKNNNAAVKNTLSLLKLTVSQLAEVIKHFHPIIFMKSLKSQIAARGDGEGVGVGWGGGGTAAPIIPLLDLPLEQQNKLSLI